MFGDSMPGKSVSQCEAQAATTIDIGQCRICGIEVALAHSKASFNASATGKLKENPAKVMNE